MPYMVQLNSAPRSPTNTLMYSHLQLLTSVLFTFNYTVVCPVSAVREQRHAIIGSLTCCFGLGVLVADVVESLGEGRDTRKMRIVAAFVR